MFTGSKLPEGAKAVIIQEDNKKLNNQLIFNTNKRVKIGSYVRKQGLDFKKIKLLLQKTKKLMLEI